jgi:hypothetical protein
MKKTISFILFFLAIGGVICDAQSQDKAKYQILFSNVMTISKEKLVLTPLKKGGEPVTVVITKDTKFFADDGRTEIKINQVKKGDELTVKCLNKQPLEAVRIRKGFYVE